MNNFHIMKVNPIVYGEFLKNSSNEVITKYKYLNTKNYISDTDTNLEKWFTEMLYIIILQ